MASKTPGEGDASAASSDAPASSSSSAPVQADGPGVYSDPKRSNQLLRSAGLCFKDRLYTDVTVVVDETRFDTHRLVLASLSDFFPPLFKLDQTNSGEVTLHEVSAQDFAVLLRFAYTGEISLTNDNVQGILMAADYLSIGFVREACELFMAQNLDCDNVCDALRFAVNYSLPHLQNGAEGFLCNDLDTVSKTPGFLEMDPDFLASFFDKDDLVLYGGVVLKSVDREELVFKAVLRFLSQIPAPDPAVFERLIQTVRLPVLSKETMKICAKKFKNIEKNEILKRYMKMWEVATRYIHDQKQDYSLTEPIGQDVEGIPVPWLHPRRLAAFSISAGSTRYAAGGQVARCSNPPQYLYNDPNLEISQIDVWIRRWDGRPVIGGLAVKYRKPLDDSRGDLEYRRGSMYDRWERHHMVLQPREYIVKVIVGSGYLIDRLGFVTSSGRTLGPFGGPGGGKHIERAPKGAMSYLHDINCDTVTTQGAGAIYNMMLRWITLE